VTLVTGITVPAIAVDIAVFIIHIVLIVGVARNAGKRGIISRVGMAVSAGIPFFPVASRIYRKVRVMYGKAGRFPSRVCGMAGGAGGGYIGC
jgi:hypothetical protein